MNIADQFYRGVVLVVVVVKRKKKAISMASLGDKKEPTSLKRKTSKRESHSCSQHMYNF